VVEILSPRSAQIRGGSSLPGCLWQTNPPRVSAESADTVSPSYSVGTPAFDRNW